MPYDPYSPSEQERANAYFLVWLGLAISLLAVAATLLSDSASQRGLLGVLIGTELVIVAASPRFDSYFRELRDFGAVVALSVLALWLAATGFVQIFASTHLGGDMASAREAVVALPQFARDPWLVASLVAVAFHAGFLFAYLRGGR